MLDVHRVRYVAIDSDADHVSRCRAEGKPVYYGDITSIELLRRLDLDTAQALVVTLDDQQAADELVAAARAGAERPPHRRAGAGRRACGAPLPVGASDAVPETVEASLQLSEAVLVDLGVPMGPVIASIHEKRAEFQASIKAMAPEAEVRQLGRRRLRDAAPSQPGGGQGYVRAMRALAAASAPARDTARAGGRERPRADRARHGDPDLRHGPRRAGPPAASRLAPAHGAGLAHLLEELRRCRGAPGPGADPARRARAPGRSSGPRRSASSTPG